MRRVIQANQHSQVHRHWTTFPNRPEAHPHSYLSPTKKPHTLWQNSNPPVWSDRIKHLTRFWWQLHGPSIDITNFYLKDANDFTQQVLELAASQQRLEHSSISREEDGSCTHNRQTHITRNCYKQSHVWWIVLHTWRGLGLLASKLPRRGPHKATGQVFLSRTCSEGWGGAAGSLVWGAHCWWPRCSPPKMLSPRGPETCLCSSGSSASSTERGLPSCFSTPWQGWSACPREGATSSHGRPCFPKDFSLPQESLEHSLSEASDEAPSLKQTHTMLFFIVMDDNSCKEKNAM